MHPTSMNNMQRFRDAYIKAKGLNILDVGSLDVNGNFKGLFIGHNYTGLDIVPGRNVDYVAEDPYVWKLDDNSFDVVISGSTFEHIQYPELTMNEIERVLKVDGLICLIAPSSGPNHGYPEDYRRYDVASFKALLEGRQFKVLECIINGRRPWYDCVLIAQKIEAEENERESNNNA